MTRSIALLAATLIAALAALDARAQEQTAVAAAADRPIVLDVTPGGVPPPAAPAVAKLTAAPPSQPHGPPPQLLPLFSTPSATGSTAASAAARPSAATRHPAPLFSPAAYPTSPRSPPALRFD